MSDDIKPKLDKDFRFKEKSKILGFIPKLWGDTEKELDPKELKESSPIMLFVDEHLNAKIYKNVNPGYLEPKNKDGDKKGFRNKIESRKIINLDYGDEKIPLYLVYELEYFNLPVDPMLDAESISRTIDLLEASHEKYKEEKERGRLGISKIKGYLMLAGGAIGIVLGAIYLGMILGIWDYLFANSGGAAEVIAENVSNAVNNSSNGSGVVEID